MSNYEVQYEYWVREFDIRSVDAADATEAGEIVQKDIEADPTIKDFSLVAVKSTDGH